jgi:hypothetical protein
MGSVIPPRTPEQRKQDRRDARFLVPILSGSVVVAAIVTFVLSDSVSVTLLAVVVAYVIVMPVALSVLLRRNRS